MYVGFFPPGNKSAKVVFLLFKEHTQDANVILY